MQVFLVNFLKKYISIFLLVFFATYEKWYLVLLIDNIFSDIFQTTIKNFA